MASGRPKSRAPSPRVKIAVGAALALLGGVVVVLAASVLLNRQRREPHDGIPSAAPKPTANQQTEQFATEVSRIIQLGQHDQAISRMRSFLAANPAETEIRSMLAMSLAQKGDVEAAEREVDVLLGQQPNHGIAHWMKAELLRKRGATGFLSHLAQAAQGQASPDLLVRVGNCYLACGEPDRAAECLRRVIGSNPARVDALASLAQVYFERRQYAESERILEQLVQAEPRAGSALMPMLGRVRMAQGDYEGALDAFEMAKQTGKGALGLAEAHAAIAAKQDTGPRRADHYRQAVEWAETAADSQDTALDGHIMAARTLYVIGGQENLRRAMSHLDAGTALAPTDGRLMDLATKLRAAMSASSDPASAGERSWLDQTQSPASQPTSQPALDFRVR